MTDFIHKLPKKKETVKNLVINEPERTRTNLNGPERTRKGGNLEGFALSSESEEVDITSEVLDHFNDKDDLDLLKPIETESIAGK